MQGSARGERMSGGGEFAAGVLTISAWRRRALSQICRIAVSNGRQRQRSTTRGLRPPQARTTLSEQPMRHPVRSIVLGLFCCVLSQFASAAVAPPVDPSASLGVVQQWIYNY